MNIKKFLTMVALLAIGICSFAQDLIITTSSKSIKAKILEVSKSEVKYKEVTNLDGPTFVLGADEIVTIIYKNGTVQNFAQSQPSNNAASTRTANATSPVYPAVKGYISQMGGEYYINNTKIAGNYIELDAWLSKNEPEIYNNYQISYRKAQNLYGCGACLFIFSLCGYGIMWGCFEGAYNAHGQIKNYAAYQAAWAFTGISSAVFAASIPIWIVGSVRRSNLSLVDYHNQHVSSYSKATPIRFELQGSENGIGLAMKF